MAITTTKTSIRYSGTGITNTFTTDFPFYDGSSLVVLVESVLQIHHVDYEVLGGNGLEGSVVFTTPPPLGVNNVSISRYEPRTQQANYQPGGPFPADVADVVHDKAVMMIQELATLLEQTIRLPDGHTAASWSGILPNPGDPQQVPPTGTNILTLSPTGIGLTQLVSSVTIPPESYPQGQCQLRLVGAQLVLFPFDGNVVTLLIDGVLTAVRIPAASAITLQPAGLTPDTFYYIYLTWQAGALVLEADGTAPEVTDAAAGFVVKTGDATRLLVGAVYVTSGPAFTDAPTARLVRTWFNDPGVTATTTYTGDVGFVTSATYTDTTLLDVQVLTWPSESVVARHQGVWSSADNEVFGSAVTMDGAVAAIAIEEYLTLGAAQRESVSYQDVLTPSNVMTTFGHLVKGDGGGGTVTFRGGGAAAFRATVSTVLRGAFL